MNVGFPIGWYVHVGMPGNNPTWGNNQARFNILENNFANMQVNNAAGLAPLNSFMYNNTVSTNYASINDYTGSCWHGGGAVVPWFNNLCILTGDPANGNQYYVNLGGCLVNAAQNAALDYNDYYSPTGQNNWRVNGMLVVHTLADWQGYGNLTKQTACHGAFPDQHSLNANPNLAGTPGAAGTCWTGSVDAQNGPQSCPSNYQLTPGSPLIGVGVNPATFATANGGSLTNPTRDYYGNTTPDGVGSGWNMGADGGHH